MEGSYEVCLGNNPAGKVQLTKQGLYFRVVCRCLVPQDTVYRLYAVCGQERENLGVVMPEEDGFLLDRRIPAKRLEGYEKFVLSDGSETESVSEELVQEEAETGTFVPICPEEPFAYLRHLESAFLEEQNGQIGAHIQEDPGAG